MSSQRLADTAILLRATAGFFKQYARLHVRQAEYIYRSSSLFTADPTKVEPSIHVTPSPGSPPPHSSYSNNQPHTDLGTAPQPAEAASPIHPTPDSHSGFVKESVHSDPPRRHEQVARPLQANDTMPAPLPAAAEAALDHPEAAPSTPVEPIPTLREARMPASRTGRLFHYGSLAAGIGLGALSENVKRAVGLSSEQGSAFVSRANVDRLVNKLSQMRGAALKLGQMLSIQDNHALSPDLARILNRVQKSANYMPIRQMTKVMTDELGPEWRSGYTQFTDVPFAAASIGQVHVGFIDLGGADQTVPVAVKVQYPGVADSIDNDLDNLRTLLIMGNFLPKGLYLDNTIRVSQRELKWETDYVREARCIDRFRELLREDPDFIVPIVIPERSTAKVLTTELLKGVSITEVAEMDQATRDWVGTKILDLSLREIFDFQFMQTDPNWSNFLYDPATHRIGLLDFGASREFDDRFTDLYLAVLEAASRGDRDQCRHYSQELGFLTGYETKQMTDIHVDSVLALGEPFFQTGAKQGPTSDLPLYAFGQQTVIKRVEKNIPYMLEHRLTPPPEETYSLHRKLSGAFLLCNKLKARVPATQLFRDTVRRYRLRKATEISGSSEQSV
ncbi:ABC1 family-domain-containing protein [Dimargaris cristalligena]|uniref:ABC1 family-domain-containing protein n=1 Tax=Dimargaris cristalligena TaxID=215637 RepID=A0A4P9ZSH0_9FUNG|nr:ABC1 family-domain-containing protein [Dimargaris cristalligena]|eukprot:RKP36504.1 ABC1 family-domain-containing protein [Dimargaris cristalligena]